jgi:two-component sensor histidine kinase
LTLTYEQIKITTEQAPSLGDFANELVSAACKYAYPSTGPGEIGISLAIKRRDHLALYVWRMMVVGCVTIRTPTELGLAFE